MTRNTESDASAAAHDLALERFRAGLPLNEDQVSVVLLVSPRTLQMWRYRGGGPEYLKIGSSVRYRPEDIVRWLQEQTRASTSDPGPDTAGSGGRRMAKRQESRRDGPATHKQFSEQSTGDVDRARAALDGAETVVAYRLPEGKGPGGERKRTHPRPGGADKILHPKGARREAD